MFSAVYSEIRLDSRLAIMYNVIFALRRILFSAITLVCLDYPGNQIQLLILGSILNLMFLTIVKPFETKKMNMVEIFNEICILAVSYHMIAFTDIV